MKTITGKLSSHTRFEHGIQVEGSHFVRVTPIDGGDPMDFVGLRHENTIGKEGAVVSIDYEVIVRDVRIVEGPRW